MQHVSIYDKIASKITKSFRDRMSDFHLNPLFKTFDNTFGIVIKPPTTMNKEVNSIYSKYCNEIARTSMFDLSIFTGSSSSSKKNSILYKMSW